MWIVVSAVSDGLLFSLATFFITRFLLSFILSAALPIIFAVPIAVGSGVGVFILSEKRGLKKRSVALNKSAFGKRMLILNACSDDKIQEILQAVCDRLQICAHVSGRQVRIGGGKRIIAALYTEEMNSDDIIRYRRDFYDSENLAIISSKFSYNAHIVAKKLGVTLLSSEDFGRFLDELSLLPAAKEDHVACRKKIAVKEFFAKKKCKTLFLYGAFLCALSPFVFYPVYYIIFGTVFIVFGLIALFFGSSPDIGRDARPILSAFKDTL